MLTVINVILIDINKIDIVQKIRTISNIVAQTVHHYSELLFVDAPIAINVKKIKQVPYFGRLLLRQVLNIVFEEGQQGL